MLLHVRKIISPNTIIVMYKSLILGMLYVDAV